MEKWFDQIESSIVRNAERSSCRTWTVTIWKARESQTQSNRIRER